MKLVIEEIARHRNGVSGEPFYVVRFAEPDEERRMLAVVFEREDGPDEHKPNGQCAVFNRALLADDVIAFGENSWRGDHYESFLRQAIAAWLDNDWKPVTEGPWVWQVSALAEVTR